MNRFEPPSSEEPIPKYRFTWIIGKINSARTEEYEELEDAKQRAVRLSREFGVRVSLYRVGLYANELLGSVLVEKGDD